MLVTTPNIRGGIIMSYTHLTVIERAKVEAWKQPLNSGTNSLSTKERSHHCYVNLLDPLERNNLKTTLNFASLQWHSLWVD